MREVVAQEQRRPRWLWVGPVCSLIAIGISIRSIVDGRVGMVLFVVLFVVLLVMAVADMLMPADRRQVVVTETELLVGRRWRVTTIARPDVRAVRGDVPDRPTWSDRVVVEHAGGEMRLPRYEEPPAVVVRRLQEWAGVGERPAAPA